MVEIQPVASVLAGTITALVAVYLTMYLQTQWQQLQSLRSMQTELEQNIERLRELARLLTGDLQRQQVDLPVEIPPGTTVEIRYVVSFPASLSTSAFEQLKHTGAFLRLPPDVRRSLLDLYDTIDRINRLRAHRERIHFDDIGNVHIVIEPSALDIEPGTTVTEADLSAETRERLADLRRMRNAMKGVNTSILRLIRSIASPAMTDELELERFAESRSRPPASATPDHGAASTDPPDIESMHATLREIERDMFWSRVL